MNNGFNMNNHYIPYDFYEYDIKNIFKNTVFILKFYWGQVYEISDLENLLKNVLPDNLYLIFFHNDYNDSFKLPNNVILYRSGLYKSQKLKNEYILPVYYNNHINYSLIDFLEPISKTSKPKICFRGFINSYPERINWLNYLKNSDLLESDFVYLNNGRGGTINELINNFKNSEFCFCPRGAGNFSIRFYEILYYGRIPVLLNTDMLLPFSDKINWNKYIVVSDNIEDLPQKIYDFWISNDIIEIQKKCKEIYNLYFTNKNLAKNIYDEVLLYFLSQN